MKNFLGTSWPPQTRALCWTDLLPVLLPPQTHLDGGNLLDVKNRNLPFDLLFFLVSPASTRDAVKTGTLIRSTKLSEGADTSQRSSDRIKENKAAAR